MAEKVPAVSVIIPMYNTEKYIAECLDSLLAQTFQDFEIITVDDCSTDNSATIVKSYAPKFNGRLKLLHMKKNSGYGSLPRNTGLKVARGKYVYFMDSDDFLLKDALENFYNTAEETQADVLICKRHLTSDGVGKKFFQEIKLYGDENDNEIQQMTVDLEIRVKYWLQNSDITTAPWSKFVTRDLLIKNNIIFLPIMQEDSIWTFELICLAKKILLVPHICYIYRKRSNSVCDNIYKAELTPDLVYKKFDRVIKGFKPLEEFMDKTDFFRQNPVYRFAVLDHIAMQNLTWISRTYKDFSPPQIYDALKQAVKKDTGDCDIVISYLVSSMVDFLRDYVSMKERIQQLEELVKNK